MALEPIQAKRVAQLPTDDFIFVNLTVGQKIWFLKVFFWEDGPSITFSNVWSLKGHLIKGRMKYVPKYIQRGNKECQKYLDRLHLFFWVQIANWKKKCFFDCQGMPLISLCPFLHGGKNRLFWQATCKNSFLRLAPFRVTSTGFSTQGQN